MILLALGTWTISSLSLAAPITFDLRAAAIELIDEANSFPLTRDGLTATLTARPSTFNEPPARNLLLDRTAASFGISVDGTTCGGLEDSAQLDDVCTAESIDIVFDHNVTLNTFTMSSFGSADLGLIMGATTINVLSTGTRPLGDILLGTGDVWSIAWVPGNGFSFDNFTATPAPTWEYLNWAAKFYADALLTEIRLAPGASW